ARDESRRSWTDDRRDGDERVLEGVTDDDRALPQALAARGTDVVLADRLEHARPRDLSEEGAWTQRKDEHRHDHVLPRAPTDERHGDGLVDAVIAVEAVDRLLWKRAVGVLVERATRSRVRECEGDQSDEEHRRDDQQEPADDVPEHWSEYRVYSQIRSKRVVANRRGRLSPAPFSSTDRCVSSSSSR